MTDLPEARAALRAMFHPPAWVQGGISTEDAEFLLELVFTMAPYRVVEVGVAAGTSSAALLFALDRATDGASGELWSLDVRETCYFDPSHPIGAAVAEMYPLHRAFWCREIDPIGARGWNDMIGNMAGHHGFLSTILTDRWAAAFDLALIDANHCHPWPLFDLLALAPALQPRAWVALHDIDLPNLGPQYAGAGSGAMWLFDRWPCEKFRLLGAVSNIGAVRLPADLGALVPMALDLLTLPQEAAVPAEGLAPVFAPIEAAARRLGAGCRAGRQPRARHRP